MKRFIRHTLMLCMLAAVAAGCRNDKPETPPVPPAPEGSKTIIAYFFGTSLSYYFSENIRTMQTAVSEGALANGERLLIYYQKSSSAVELREMRYDYTQQKVVTDVLDSFTQTQPLTAQSFADNVKTLIDYAPADSYSIIFLGHATAWLPKNPIETGVATYGLKPKFVPSFEKMPGAAVTRHIGESNVNLDIDELAEGLQATGVKFDCLYFDVCFMSSLEAAYELRNTADVIIGSPCEIMGNGSPYDRILKPLALNDYKTVCEEYADFYENYFYPSGCIAAIDCSKLEAVAEVVKRINAAPTAAGFDLASVQPYEGRSNTGRYAGHWFYDAEDYFRQICSEVSLVEELRTALAECVPYRYHTRAFYSAYNDDFNTIDYFSGINITPDEKCIEAIGESEHRNMLEYYNPSLRQTAWYKATH